MGRIQRTLQYIAFFALGVFLLYWALRGIDFLVVRHYLMTARYEWIVLALFVTWISHVIRGARWKLLLEGIGYPVTTTVTYHSLILGYLMNMVLPRAGEVTRCVALNRLERVPISTLLGSVVAERGLDLLFLAGLVLFNLILEFDLLTNWMGSLRLAAPSGTLLVAGSIGIGMGGIVVWMLMHRFRDMPLMVKVREKLRQFVQGVATLRRVRRPALFWLQSISIWALYWMMTYLPFFAFDFTSGLSPVAGLTVFTVSSIGFIMPVQAGIGTYHWAAATAFGLYGIPWEQGMTMALVMHTSQMLLIVLLGMVSLPWYFYHYHRKTAL